MDTETLAVVFVVAAVVLCALEIVAPGLVLLPFGLGAGMAAIAGFLGVTAPWQVLIFLVSSAGFFLALRPIGRRLNAQEHSAGIGSERLIGVKGVVLEDIPAGETGLVRIDREEWRAEAASGHPLPRGLDITVVELRGTRVVVTPEKADPLGTVGGTTT